MDDLSGLDWSTSSSANNNKPPVLGTGNYFTTLLPTSTASSGRSTPLPLASGTPKSTTPIPKATTTDSFSNLVSFGSNKPSSKLTLQEQQERLQAEKTRRAQEQKRQYEAQFGPTNFWDGLGSKPSSAPLAPSIPHLSSTATTKVPSAPTSFSGMNGAGKVATVNEDDDLFAAFKSATKVDNSSHYPPPTTSAQQDNNTLNKHQLDLTQPQAWSNGVGSSAFGDFGEDDDPFGLTKMAPGRSSAGKEPLATDNDDFLGDLAKPVEQVKRKAKDSAPVQQRQEPGTSRTELDDPWDKAVNELVDMGFTAENSRRALTESGAGLNIQAAVSWLLNDAHRQAKEKTQAKKLPEQRVNGDNGEQSGHRHAGGSGNGAHVETVPAWMRADGRGHSQPRRDDSRSPANSDSDLAKTAAAVGSNLLKTANSLWKTSQKKVAKAVQEFSQESDPSQPKWMRDASLDRQAPREKQPVQEDAQKGRPERTASPSVTDEALMLEADARPPPRKSKPASDPRFADSGAASPRENSPAVSNPSTGRSTPVPRWQQQGPSSLADDLRTTRLTKQDIEDQSAQAYVSPARRKKATPTPAPKPFEEQPDLLFGGTSQSVSRATPTPPQPSTLSQSYQPASSKPPLSKPSPLSSSTSTPRSSTPIPIRPKAPTRTIPPLSPTALASSTKHRHAGTAHFKRGDYAAAHSSYSSSLTSLGPPTHPLAIVLLCNRSLTALKTGDPKAAVSDADAALALIGPSRGEGETIDFGSGNGNENENGDSGAGAKPMGEYFAKALQRKAEALEQMERWGDAGDVWQLMVEAGVGGPLALQGRQRCDKALNPKAPLRLAPSASVSATRAQPPAAARPGPPPRTAAKPTAPAGSGQEAEAVTRLREANAAAERADDERFALSDAVDARIARWRDGRRDNLRALLGGLDQVLWEGSGWKKVGMGELVMVGRVKIVYMKAVAKCHPDKVSFQSNVFGVWRVCLQRLQLQLQRIKMKCS